MRILALVMMLMVLACSERPQENPTAETVTGLPQVYAVNFPLAWAATELAAERAEVHFVLPADIDPAYWEPTLEELAPWQQADLVLRNGAGYAAWLDSVSLRGSTQVDTSGAFAGQLIPVEGGPVHSHGFTGEHSHGAMAFTLWLDLEQYGWQVQAIADALSSRLAQGQAGIADRNREIQQRLKPLDARLLGLGEELSAAALLYSHPVYQYLDRRYGLNGRALHWEPGQALGPDELAALDDMLAVHPASLMLWEDEPLAQTREQLAQRGVAIAVFRPLGNRPQGGDFLAAMEANIDALQEAITQMNNEVIE